MFDGLLTIGDLERIFKCSRSSIYRWIDDGEFPSPIKIGKLSRWSKESIEKYFRDRGGFIVTHSTQEKRRPRPKLSPTRAAKARIKSRAQRKANA